MHVPVLALGFGTPLLLWGIALAGIPLAIHLLHRRRYVEAPWAAMQFLAAAARSQSQRLRIEQWLLLAARMLIVALAALALSRPSVTTLTSLLRPEQPVQRVILIDATPSLGAQGERSTRFDRAKDLARQLIDATRPGDALHLVRISALEPQVLVRGPAYAAGPVLAEIDQLTLGDDRGDVETALREALALLSLAPDLERRELWVLTDLQSAAWQSSDAAVSGRIRSLLLQLSERCQLRFLDLGQGPSENLAVTRFETPAEVLLAGRPTPITAALRNYASHLREAVAVELVANGRLIDTRRVDVPPAQEVTLDFAPLLPTGQTRLELRLPQDDFPLDDQRRLAIDVRNELKVLLVNGQAGGEPLENATEFLRLALDPSGGAKAAATPFRPVVITDGELLSTKLAEYDVVFACNVTQFTEREADVLRRYVIDGGGLIVSLGDQVRADNYNQILAAGETPLLPGRLTGRVGGTVDRTVVYDFATSDFAHPIVKPFAGNPGAGLELTRTFAYERVEPVARGARVALAFDSGDPAILEAPLGRGRCVLITTALDRRWSTWAVWGHSFIPLMHETVLFAARGRSRDRQLLAGQSLELAGSSDADASLVIKRPDGSTESLSGGQAMPVAERAGFYELQFGPQVRQTEWLAVNGDPRESDLVCLTESELRNDLAPGVNLSWHATLPELSTADGVGTPALRTGTSAARWLLLASLGLLLAEPLLAGNARLGMAVLGSLVLSSGSGAAAGSTVGWLVFLACGMAIVLWQRGRPATAG